MVLDLPQVQDLGCRVRRETDGKTTHKLTKLTKEGNIGAAYVVAENKTTTSQRPLFSQAFHLQDYHSVYQAELTAITKAVNFLTNRPDLPDAVTIPSDSKSSLMALCKYATPSRTLERGSKLLNALSQRTRLTLRWIKSHIGTIGNEKPYELAKTCASNSTDDVRTLDDIPAPYSFLVKKVKEGTCRLWTNRWMTEQNPDGSRRYRQSKIFFPQTIKSKSYFVIKQDKTTLFRLIQFITGHAFMRRHNYLMQGNGDEPQPPCRLCLQGTPPPPILRRHFSHENDDLWKRYPAPQH